MHERKNALLLAPCGSGKTLAVVYNWLKERPTKHLIYVLPTTTLLKSIKHDIIELIEGKERKPDAVKELGYRIVNLEQTEFSDPKLISIATDYGEERESKLYAHDIIITTMDSYIARLYRSSLTPKKFRDLPIARIFNSTTIFDEAQMYDNYTHTLARYTFKLLREGKAHHIVMTATLSDKMVEFIVGDRHEIEVAHSNLINSYLLVPDELAAEYVSNLRQRVGDVVLLTTNQFPTTIRKISEHEALKIRSKKLLFGLAREGMGFPYVLPLRYEFGKTTDYRTQQYWRVLLPFVPVVLDKSIRKTNIELFEEIDAFSIDGANFDAELVKFCENKWHKSIAPLVGAI